MVSTRQKSRPSWPQRRKRLAQKIVSCLRNNAPASVNLSIPNHTITAPVLRQFAYDEEWANRSLPIVYLDRSRPTPFPLGVFDDAEPPSEESLPHLCLGLNSFRHVDIDFLADLYLLTNVDVDQSLNMAETDQQACEAAFRILKDPAIRDGAVVRVLHTGLEPIVVGFYRGVVDVLRSRKRDGLSRTLIIIPCLFAHYSGKALYTQDSPGAKLESYIECQPWW